METINLINYRFLVHMQTGGDTWCLSGKVYGHPNYCNGEFVYISTPKYFNEEKMTVTTCSGRTYKLECPADDPEKIHQEIRDVIKMGGYCVV